METTTNPLSIAIRKPVWHSLDLYELKLLKRESIFVWAAGTVRFLETLKPAFSLCLWVVIFTPPEICGRGSREVTDTVEAVVR